MRVAKALKKWGYKSTMRDRLEEACRACPKRFVRDGEVIIPDDADPIYIPTKAFRSNGAVYSHLMKACIERKEVIPESLGVSHDDLDRYLKQLELMGMIVHGDDGKLSTLRYVPTPKGEEWPTWKNKVRELVKIVEPLVPEITINA